MKKYTTLDNLKQKNISDILLYIMHKGKTSRREIQQATGFSWGTVSTSVANLIEKGYVKEFCDESSTSSVGRKTAFLALNGDKIVGLGIDVNRTAIESVVISFDGDVKFSKTYDFDANSLDEVLSLMERVIDELIAFCKDKYEIKSLGISFQGEIDGEKGLSFAFPGIDDWKTFNVKEYFAQKYYLPIYFEHDPKCMLYSVKSTQSVNDVLLIRADDGIGLSVMQNGKIMEDQKRLELGHTLILSDNSFDRSKNLEYFSSLSGISKRAKVLPQEFKKNPHKYNDFLEKATDYLSIAIYNLSVLFAPQKIILTGELFSVSSYEKSFRKKFNKLTDNKKIELVLDLNLSAAKGVALNALKYNVKNKV